MPEGTIVIKTDIDLAGIRSGISKIKKSVNDVGNSTSQQLGKCQQKTTDMRGSVVNLAEAFGLIKVASKAFDVIVDSMDDAISRFDIMSKYPKVMSSLGFSAQDSTRSIKELAEGIEGLPTSLDTVVSTTQRIASISGNLQTATQVTLALNNAFLASGSSTEDAARGMEQYIQMMSKGTVDLQSWRSLQETMPVALQKVAESFGLTGESAQRDLYDKLKSGEITFDEFQQHLINLATGEGQLAQLSKTNSEGIGTSFQNLKTAVVKGLADMIDKVDEAVRQTTGTGIADHLNNLKGVIRAFFDVAGTALSVILPPLIKLFEFLKPFQPLIAGILTTFLSYKAITAILPIFGKLKKSIDDVKTAFSMISGIKDVMPALEMVVSNPIVLIIAAIAGLVAAIIYLWNTNEGFRNTVITSWNSIKTAGIEIFTGLKNFFVSIGEGIKTVITSIANFFTVTIPSAVQSVIQWFTDNGQTILMAVTNPVGMILTYLYNHNESFRNWVNGIIGFFKSIPGGVRDAMTSVIDAVKNGIHNAKTAITDKATEFYNAGKNLIDGLKNGFIDGFNKVKDFVKEKAGEVVDTVKDVFGINSPSKVFYDIAIFCFQGLENGFNNSDYASLGETAANQVLSAFDGVKDIDANVTAHTQVTPVDESPIIDMASAAQQAQNSQLIPLSTATQNNAQLAEQSLIDGLTAQEQTLQNSAPAMLTSSEMTYASIPKAAESETQKADTTVKNHVNSTIAYLNGTDNTGAPAMLLSSSQILFVGLSRASSEQSTRALSIVRSGITSILAYLRAQAPQFYSIATAMAGQFAKGMSDRTSAVKSTADKMVQAVKDAFIKGLGIHSPSTEAYKWGYYTVAGYVGGFKDTLKSAQLTSMVDSTVKDMNNAFKGGAFNADTNVHYMQDDSLKEVSWINGHIKDDNTGGKGARALGIMTNLVNDNSHGYSQANRWGPDFDCSSSIIYSLRTAGFDTGAASYTGNMRSELTKRGWQAVPNNGNPQRGDILLNDAHHVEWALGNGKIAGFHSNYDGRTGDSTGREANIHGYYDYPWNVYLRYPGFGSGSGLADAIQQAYENWKYPISSLVGSSTGMYGRGLSPSTQRWAATVVRALELTGQSRNYVGDILWAIQNESGGNPRAINNWDSNARRGDPSRGLMQTIGATFRAYRLPNLSADIYDPLSNIVAGIRYMLARYGSISKVIGPRRQKWFGYRVGTRYVPYDQYTMVHKGEAIIRKSENPYANSNGGFVTKMLEDAVFNEMNGIRRRIGATSGMMRAGDTITNNTINFQKTPERPSEVRASIIQASRRLANG